MVNYDSISGVTYRRYLEDDDPDNATTDQDDAEIDEFYFDYGKLHLTLKTDDGYLSIDIPILPMDKWDGFVNSLPTWDGQ